MTFDFSSEIIIDVPAADMVARTETILRANGWRQGRTTETPNRGQLLVAGRERSKSYRLRSSLPYWEHDWAEAIASNYEGRIVFVNEGDFTEWTAGRETIHLDSEHNGEFRGVEWYDIEEGQASPKELPGAFVAALKQPYGPDDLTGQLAAALHGKGGPDADEAALDFYRPYDGTLKSDLEPLFVAIRERAAQRQVVEIRGFATFKRRELADIVVPSADDAAFQSCFSGAAMRVTLDKNLLPEASTQQLAGLESKLQSICSRIHAGKEDVLLGAGLAIGSLEFPGYDGRNPRTGEVVKVPPKRIPYFVGW